MKAFITALTLAAATAIAAAPRDALPLDLGELPQNYRLHVEFSTPATGSVRLSPQLLIPLSVSN